MSSQSKGVSMGLDSGRPFPQEKLLWLRGRKRGRYVPRSTQHEWEWGSEGTEGPGRASQAPSASQCVVFRLQKDNLHCSASPSSAERMSTVPGEGASHRRCDEAHSGLTLILLPTQYVTLASDFTPLSLSFPSIRMGSKYSPSKG